MAAFEWNPRVGQELGQVEGTAACGRGAGIVAVDAGGDHFGVVAVVADGMPSPTLLSSEGIEAVVALYRRGGRPPGQHNWRAVSSGWLRPPAWQALAHARAAGGRVAQEAVAHRTVAKVLC